MADAATTLAYAALVLWRVPEPDRGPSAPAGAERASLGGPLRDPIFATFAGLNSIFGTVFAQGGFTLPVDMQAHGVTPREFGIAIALNGVLIVALQLPASRLLARPRAARVLAGACVFTGVGFGLTGLVATAPLYAATIAVWTLGEILNAAVGPSVVSQLAPADQRGSYQGVYHMTWGLASLAGPLVGGALLARAGSGALWLSCGAAAGVAALGYLLLGPALERRLGAVAATAPAAKGLSS